MDIEKWDYGTGWVDDITLYDNLQHYENCNELIDSNDMKFKYGLFWYLIYDRFENRSDYHYQDLIVLNEDEIKARLKKVTDKLLINYLLYPHRNENYLYLFELINELKKIRVDILLGYVIPTEKSFDLIDIISEIMYYILTNPKNYYRKKNLFGIIAHAANRVCRNYIAAGLIPDAKGYIMSLIDDYYKSKNETKNIHAGW